MLNETNTPQNKFDLRRAAEASRSIGFFAKAKELQKNYPIAANVLKLGTAAVIVGIGGAITTSELTQPTPAQNDATEHQKLTDAEAKSYTDSITAAINANYDQKAMIGNEIDIAPGGTILDPALERVVKTIGKDKYHKNQSQIYDALNNSAQRLNAQPGDRVAVVATDIDPAKKNGIEYVTVDISHVNSPDGGLIPSPQQKVNPSEQLNDGTVGVELTKE